MTGTFIFANEVRVLFYRTWAFFIFRRTVQADDAPVKFRGSSTEMPSSVMRLLSYSNHSAFSPTGTASRRAGMAALLREKGCSWVLNQGWIIREGLGLWEASLPDSEATTFFSAFGETWNGRDMTGISASGSRNNKGTTTGSLRNFLDGWIKNESGAQCSRSLRGGRRKQGVMFK
jgi:hypothetical protein